MPPSETIRRIALDGPFSIGQLVAIGLVVALVCGFTAWRDCRATASYKRFILLFLSRLTALLVVLWMLAGASLVTIGRSLRPKAVVFLVDSSGSMGLTDPVDRSGSTLRWSAAESKLADLPAIGALDAVIGTLRSVQSSLDSLRQEAATPDSNPQSQNVLEQVRQSVQSAADELAALAPDAARTDPESGAELGRVADFLKQGLAGSLSRTGGTHQAREDRIDDQATFIAAALQRIERSAWKLASLHEQAPTQRGQAGLTAQSRLTRGEKVSTWLETAEKSWLKDIEANARVLRYAFNSEVQPVPEHSWRQILTNQATSAASATDLGAALTRAAQDAAKQSVAAVVLVTDGGHNAAGDPRELAAALRGVPLDIVPIGTTEMPRDVILHHTHAPRAVFKNDTVIIDSMITAFGCAGEQLRVELLSDRTVVDHQTLTASTAMFDGRVSFHWKAAELGRHSLRVRVLPLPNEHSLDNNEAQVEVEVMEDTIRVLLADDLPRWEFRYLVNLFKRDKHIDFEQLLFEPNDGPTATARPAFPKDVDAWRRYRVVILGDLSPAQLPAAQQELLRKYVVEEGGNLVIIAGETAMPAAFANQPLGAMIPAVAGAPAAPNEGFRLSVTAEGSASVATQLEDDPLASDRVWREMSAKLPIYNLSPIAKPKPTSHVLIAATSARPGAEPEAFLSWQYIGLGRVIYVAAPVTYQLRYRNGDLYHHRFWGQLLRWAIAREMSGGSKTVHLITDKNVYSQGDEAQIALRLTQADGRPVSGAQASVEARQDGNLVKLVEVREEPGSPGEYRGTYGDLPLGPITLRAAGSTVQSLLRAEGRTDPVEEVITVDPKGTSELSNPLCNLPLLQQLADAGGGLVLPPCAVQNAISRLNLAPDVQETTLSREPLWDRWSLLWIFIACLTIEWLARRYWRMA